MTATLALSTRLPFLIKIDDLCQHRMTNLFVFGNCMCFLFKKFLFLNFSGIPVDTKIIQHAGLHSIPSMTKAPNGN